MGAPTDPLPPPLQALGLVFVAVYQKALKLSYVDTLLERAARSFVPRYKPGAYGYPEFDDPFKRMLEACESKADAARRTTGGPLMARTAGQGEQVSCAGWSHVAVSRAGAGHRGSGAAPHCWCTCRCAERCI